MGHVQGFLRGILRRRMSISAISTSQLDNVLQLLNSSSTATTATTAAAASSNTGAASTDNSDSTSVSALTQDLAVLLKALASGNTSAALSDVASFLVSAGQTSGNLVSTQA